MAKKKRRRQGLPRGETGMKKPEYQPPTEWELDETFSLGIDIVDGETEEGEPNIVRVYVELREPSFPEHERAAQHGTDAMAALWDACIVDKSKIRGRYMIPVMEALAVHFMGARRHTTEGGESGTDDPMSEILDLAQTG